MSRWTLAFCCVAAMTLTLLGGGDKALANDTPAATPEANSPLPGRSHGRSVPRARKTAQPAKVDEKKAAAGKAQPWFAVDPDRAVLPPDPAQAAAEAKPAVPTAKWEKDRFDFGSKVSGSNDFHLLPRFDANDSPQGLGGQMGINLHF